MLHKRRIEPNIINRVLSYRNLAFQKVCKDYEVTQIMLDVLFCIECLQKETNKLIDINTIVLRTGYARKSIDFVCVSLIHRGYLDRVKNTFRGCKARYLYNVTYQGCIILKSVTVEMSKMLTDNMFSEWLRIQAQDPGVSKYLAPVYGTVDHKPRKPLDKRPRKKDIKKG